MVNSAEVTALWHLAQALRAGRVGVMFADGNSGMNRRRPGASSLSLPFLGCTISARTGIAALAAHTGAPILRVRTRDPSGGPPRMTFDEPIEIDAGESKDAFRERATRALFRSLEEEIEREPSHWKSGAVFPEWVVARPAPPPGPPCAAIPLALPALVGQRLELASPSWWIVSVRGTPELLDVACGRWLPASGR